MNQLFDHNLLAAKNAFSSGDMAIAQQFFEMALTLTDNGGINLEEYLECLFGLSQIYGQIGAYDKEEAIVVRALSTIQKRLGKETIEFGRHLNDLAIVRLHQGKLKEAESVLLESIKIIEKCFNSKHPELLKSLENLGHIYQEQNLTSKAIQSWERAISIREKEYGVNDPGIKFFKNICKETLAASRKAQKTNKPTQKRDEVQLMLFTEIN